MMVNIPQKISVLDLCYYLDAQRQDGIDRGSQSCRTGQVLALREKLLLLPGQEFDLAIRTLSKMVDGKADQSGRDYEQQKDAAIELYQQSKSKDSSVSKVGAL